MLSESARYWANDFGQYWSGAQRLAAGYSPYAWVAESRPLTAHDYHYPPLLAILLAPASTMLNASTAITLWAIIGMLSLLGGVWLSYRGLRVHSPRAARAVLFAAAVVLPAATWAVGLGQLSPELLVLTAGLFAALQAGHPRLAGSLLAVGGLLKAFPFVLLLYLWGYQQWPAFRAAVVGAALLGLACLIVLGSDLAAYLTTVLPAQRAWLAWLYNQSLAGLIARLAIGPMGDPPTLTISPGTLLVIGLTSLSVVAQTGYAVRRAARYEGRGAVAFALCVVTMLLVSPINGNYNGALLLVPLAVLFLQLPQLGLVDRALGYGALALFSLPVEYCGNGLPRLCQALEAPVLGMLLLYALFVRRCLAEEWRGEASRRQGLAVPPAV
jgi:hypothetical protein